MFQTKFCEKRHKNPHVLTTQGLVGKHVHW